MSEINLDAVMRTDFGKGAARQARRENMIPAVVYGAGSQPVHVLLPAHATTLAARDRQATLVLNVDGKEIKTTIKDLQTNVISRAISHLDLLVAA